MTSVRDRPGGRATTLAIVGALLGAVEATVMWRIGLTEALVAFAYLGAVGTIASVIDMRTRRLPNKVILPSYPIMAALLAVAAGLQQDWWPLERAVIAATVVAGFYLALGLGFPHGFGFGDVKLGGLLALGLGWLGWSTLATGVLAGWCLAALVVLAVRVIRPGRWDRNRTVALGPWLCLGALVAVAVR